jgi:hypothetical protein
MFAFSSNNVMLLALRAAEQRLTVLKEGYFQDVGATFGDIKQQGLFKAAGFLKFKDYNGTPQLGVNYRFALRLIHAAAVVSSFPSGILLPEHERQVRPLVGLDSRVALTVWQHGD